MYDEIVNWENLVISYNKTRKGGFKYRDQAVVFAQEESLNLKKLYESLVNGLYYPAPYSRFYVLEPKRRLVNAPSYRDKIVQHMVNNILLPYFSKRYIYDSYACIIGKGNRKAVARTSQLLTSSISMWGSDAYVVKIDIKKFFYTINHRCLMNILERRIPCRRTRFLLSLIIYSTGENLGLPLGNLTSQILANIYMNEFDQFVKHELRIRHYVRYADDIILIVNGKDRAREVLASCEKYLNEYLKLEIHETKSHIQLAKTTVSSLGFRYKKSVLDVDKKFRKKVIRYLMKLPEHINIKYTTGQAERTINSWMNHIRATGSETFIDHLIKRFDYIEKSRRGVVKIVKEYHNRNIIMT